MELCRPQADPRRIRVAISSMEDGLSATGMVLWKRSWMDRWDIQAKDNPFADKLNKAKKYVVSKTLRKLDWENSMLVKGNIPEEIRKLKKEDGPELQVHGSSNLIQTLLKHDLVDEFWLKIYPVTIGNGKRLFGVDTIPASFKLLESKTSTAGVIVATYRRDGEIKTGSFDLNNQTRELKP